MTLYFTILLLHLYIDHVLFISHGENHKMEKMLELFKYEIIGALSVSWRTVDHCLVNVYHNRTGWNTYLHVLPATAGGLQLADLVQQQLHFVRRIQLADGHVARRRRLHITPRLYRTPAARAHRLQHTTSTINARLTDRPFVSIHLISMRYRPFPNVDIETPSSCTWPHNPGAVVLSRKHQSYKQIYSRTL